MEDSEEGVREGGREGGVGQCLYLFPLTLFPFGFAWRSLRGEGGREGGREGGKKKDVVYACFL